MPCPPSRAEAPSFFSSPAAATPCRPPRRSASITCRPIRGRPAWFPRRCSETKSRSSSPTSRASSAARPSISARCRPCSSRSRRCRTRWACWSSAARSCPSPQQMSEAASVGHAFALALDRAHATGEADLQVELRELLQAFSRDVSSTTLVRGARSALHRREPPVRRRPHIGLAPRSARAHGRPLRLVRCRVSRAGAAHPDLGCARARGARAAPRARRDRRNGHGDRRRADRRW